MKMMRTVLMIALLALAMPLAAQAQQLFDFNGQVVVPTVVGGTLSMNSMVLDAPPTTTPIPLDFVNYEYTIVIDGLALDTIGGMTDTYSGGTITLYQDAATAADYANGATFSDGVAVLSGVVTSLSRTMFTSTLGTVNGLVTWTGGTNLNDMAPLDQLDWPILSGISVRVENVVPGYDENWDGKVEPTQPIVANETMSWSDLKKLF